MAKETIIRVRVKPRAKEDRVVAMEGDVLRVSVRAAPERGKANVAVCKVIARWLDVPSSIVRIVSGGRSREKQIAVAVAPSVVRRSVDLLLPGEGVGYD